MTKEQITVYMHCRRCVERKQSPPRIDVGLTSSGLLLWCERHDEPIAHITPDQLRDLLASGPVCSICGQSGPHMH